MTENQGAFTEGTEGDEFTTSVERVDPSKVLPLPVPLLHLMEEGVPRGRERRSVDRVLPILVRML